MTNECICVIKNYINYLILLDDFNVNTYLNVEACLDSAYIVNCFNSNWRSGWENNGWKNAKKKPVENKDLWIALFKEVDRFGNKLTFSKTKGHSGVKWNEFADELANKAMNDEEERRDLI